VHKPSVIEVIPGPLLQPHPKGAPPLGGAAAPNPHPQHKRKTNRPPPDLIQPVQVQPEPAPDLSQQPAEEPEPDESEFPGSPGAPTGLAGVPGGDPYGIGQPGGFMPGPVPFEEGRMTAPRCLSGPDPTYTPQALDREVQGTMLVRCIVTREGAVYGCRVLKSLPFMDAAVIRALEQRRY